MTDKKTQKSFEVAGAETLVELLKTFPRTMTATRMIGDGAERWRVTVDPVLEDELEARQTFFCWMPPSTFPFGEPGVGKTYHNHQHSEQPQHEDFSLADDLLKRWADVDFAGLEKRVNALGRLNGAAEEWDEDDRVGTSDGLLEEMVGKMDANRDNTEDNLGRIREVSRLVDALTKRIADLEPPAELIANLPRGSGIKGLIGLISQTLVDVAKMDERVGSNANNISGLSTNKAGCGWVQKLMADLNAHDNVRWLNITKRLEELEGVKDLDMDGS